MSTITIYLHKINIIAPVADTAALNVIWTLFGPEGDSEVDTFGVPLSADGNEPATHSGISTAATEDMRHFIVEEFAEELDNCAVSVQDYRANDWAELLQANGLQVVEPDEVA